MSDQVIIPVEAWKLVTCPVYSKPGARSPGALTQAIKTFSVETNPRYTPNHPSPGTTYCNVLCTDVLQALGTPPTHWYDILTGAPTQVGTGSEMSANKMVDWFKQFGATFGWKPVGLADACAAAQRGEISIVIWKNPNPGPGHVAVMTPDSKPTAPIIGQAGGTNFSSGPLARGFGNLPVLFWTHT